MMLSLYRMFTTLSGPLISLYLSRRLKQGKEDPARFSERLGIPSLPRPEGKLLWIHAASVGESISMLKLIELVLQKYSGWSVLVTTGTVTSAKLMGERLSGRAFHQYAPVDRVGYVRKFLDTGNLILAFGQSLNFGQTWLLKPGHQPSPWWF